MTVRDWLRLRLEPLIGPGAAREFADGLPRDSYGLQFRVRPGGEIGSQGIERIELFRLIHTFNFYLEGIRKAKGSPAKSLDDLVEEWRSQARNGRLSPGLAAIVGHSPRLPKHPSGEADGWQRMPLVDGLLVLPPGPSIEQMYASPVAMPAKQ
jgi:hypothetical protein